MGFDWGRAAPEHRKIAERYIGSLDRLPDLTITTDEDEDYLYRWHVVPRDYGANVYFHVQVASDPERPLHDHPWPNMSVLLAGHYNELVQERPPKGETVMYRREQGQTIYRKAAWAHRLLLPAAVPYVMTQFVTGPIEKKWGFWIDDEWYSHNDCSRDLPGGRSVFVYPPGTSAQSNGF